jgi:predicted  nucleic acid-binding Zn-ribbon protein
MALANSEIGMESRIARLEADVAHIRSDVADVKQDVRALRDRLDEANERNLARMDAMDVRLSGRIDSLQRELATAKVWALLLYITLAGAVYGTLARTMGWI